MTIRMRTGTETVAKAGNALADLLNEWLTGYGPSAIYKNCDNCVFMTQSGPAHCAKFNAVPPAAVIVIGCDEHEDKEKIPF